MLSIAKALGSRDRSGEVRRPLLALSLTNIQDSYDAHGCHSVHCKSPFNYELSIWRVWHSWRGFSLGLVQNQDQRELN